MALIDIHEVQKRYETSRGPGVEALRSISLSIGSGEFVSLLGPSGCGKSTLLFMIAGLERADAGGIRCNGQPVTDADRQRSVVFQDYALLPWRTVSGNVGLPLEGHLREPEKLQERVRQYIHMVGLKGFEQAYPAHLSGGMRQRVALARALATEPAVLLLDEPFAALDAQMREILQTELLQIWQRTGTTMVFVTHSIDEAVFMSQRVVVMTARPGQIKAQIQIDEPYPRTPEFRSTARFGQWRAQIYNLLAEELPPHGRYN